MALALGGGTEDVCADGRAFDGRRVRIWKLLRVSFLKPWVRIGYKGCYVIVLRPGGEDMGAVLWLF